ncbi:MAG: hypothetical protein OEY95_01520 [Candidatus Bathyarchaeota archaeon]|nr:hypothetical protein [Candidatus Bathyarchaeota archaeon]
MKIQDMIEPILFVIFALFTVTLGGLAWLTVETLERINRLVNRICKSTRLPQKRVLKNEG